jgi:hypothetical protein
MRRPEKCSKAGTVDAPVTDPFALEDQVATAVATALGLELKADETRELAFHGTTMPDAYNYYTQARGYLPDASKTADVDSAIILLEQALKVDPNYGRAEADLRSDVVVPAKVGSQPGTKTVPLNPPPTVKGDYKYTPDCCN